MRLLSVSSGRRQEWLDAQLLRGRRSTRGPLAGSTLVPGSLSETKESRSLTEKSLNRGADNDP